MSSVQPLREFIRQRLTAAAEEIFSEVEKTIIQYQEEIDRLHELQQNHVGMEEKLLNDQLLNNQERHCRVDQEKPEPVWVKEEQDEFQSLQIKQEWGEPEPCQNKEEELKAEQNDMFISQEQEQFVQKETEILIVSHPELQSKQVLYLNSSESENQHQQGSTEEDAGWSGTQGTNPGEENRGGPEGEGPKRPDAEEDLFCKICGKFFSTKCRLLKHLQTHTGEKPFVCPTCGKGFSVRRSLVNHMRTHTKPFVCKTCGKKFSLRSSLRIHMSVHTSERPLSCGNCGKSFFRRSALNEHTTTHEGEKPFSCKICGRGFLRKGDLNVHMRAHTGKPFECELCGKRLSRRCLLIYHMRTHTGERPFSCLTCGKGFCTNGDLTSHIKRHTGGGVS
ncbi:histone-lysine N-methyltransferase PRDM9-like isoform X9 [Cyprinodon tularosa]|uniref:histone-lysine N-methyltransferase PRDM9-like isoform X6 n=1 Tax=Cyprinodon tularosa TaxID=77115 RepID=UPI0018E23504|nr:histone-lysine N-methyltransferase PRDM9-like isoform X6 [Cyprinodon tularosa]XP_038153198.1 histone-lysine N-methyltransferase PRDM9-like isoform X8 [Cyprinodon tularosa]XP_038153199.1 histone-lysine N-methyltransferase PRDM9-like isoform X9 [Cyprinodon tularosa]